MLVKFLDFQIGIVCNPSTGVCKPKFKPAGCIKIKSANLTHIARNGSFQGFKSLSL